MTVRSERHDGTVVLTLARPEAKNAISVELARELGRSIAAAAADPATRAIALAAEGDVFVSGGDLKEFAELARRDDGAEAVLGLFEPLSTALEADVPLIAAVHADAIGGGAELVLLCDLLVMERDAGLSFRHARMGLSPAWGAVTHLCELCGPAGAARALLTGERLDAEACLRLGLASDVVDSGHAIERALELGRAIAQSPRESVARLKELVRDVRAARRGESYALERSMFRRRWGGPDHRAALEAFARRR